MTLRVWPDTLPVATIDGYRLSPMDQAIRTDMEVGFPRHRRITTARHDVIEVSWRFTDAEMTAFRAFFGDMPWSLAGDSDSLVGWATSNVTISADAASGPDGALADRLREDTANATHHAQVLIDQTALPESTDLLFRATLKSSGRTWGRLVIRDYAGSLHRVDVNLSTGALSSPVDLVSYTAEDRGSGWWRVTIRANSGTGATPPLVRINVLEGDGVGSYTGDGSSGILACEVNARVPTGYDLFVRTGADGRALGADGGSAWFSLPLAFGGGIETVSARFAGPWNALMLPGLGWEVSGRLEVRDA